MHFRHSVRNPVWLPPHAAKKERPQDIWRGSQRKAWTANPGPPAAAREIHVRHRHGEPPGSSPGFSRLDPLPADRRSRARLAEDARSYRRGRAPEDAMDPGDAFSAIRAVTVLRLREGRASERSRKEEGPDR